MPVTNAQPTSVTTPDAVQGGIAVTGAVNTGHGSTVCSASNDSVETKTCIWTTFSPTTVAGSKVSVKLKFDWSKNGVLSLGNNRFRVQYSINNGGAWNTVFDSLDFDGSSSGSETVVLSNSQDISQVQVRDLIQSDAAADDTTITTATVSAIKVEITTSSPSVIAIM